jgi:hypothetical protein
MGFAFDYMIAWFLVSVAVIVITLVTAQKFTRHSQKLTSHLERIATENSEAVKKIISEVARLSKSSDRLIEFFGAASLAAPEGDGNLAAAELKSGQKTSSRIYMEAIELATKKHVLMKRYISLFKEPELRERSLKIQEQYLTWLKHQVQLLSNYDRYELADVVRAPNWGTNMARIITKKHVMEITGNGKAAIVITDEHIAQRINQYAHESVIGKNRKNLPKIFGNSSEATETLEAFESYVHMVERIYHEELRKEEEKLKEQERSRQESTSGSADVEPERLNDPPEDFVER